MLERFIHSFPIQWKYLYKGFLFLGICLILSAIALAFFYSDHFVIFFATTLSLLFLCALIMIRIRSLWKERIPAISGARFRLKVISIFSGLVIGPCIIMAIFAILFLEVGIQAWFHQRVQTAVQESQNVAQAYLHEHQKVIKHTIQSMTQGLNEFFNRLSNGKELAILSPQEFFVHHRQDLGEYLTVHEAFRSVREAIIFTIKSEERPFFSSSRRIPLNVVAYSRFSLSLGFKSLSEDNLRQADQEGIFLSLNENGDQVFAITPIFFPLKAYLLVSRDVDKSVLQKIKMATQASDAYHYLLKKQGELALQFIIIFLIFSLFLLLLAIWAGLSFSRQFIAPIEQLIDAAQSVRSGHLKTVEYDQDSWIEELRALTSTFNSMVMEMTLQKENLLTMNHRLEERSHFIENVLASTSSAVISLTSEGKITLYNKSAQDFLGQRALADNPFLEVIAPEFKEVLCQARLHPGVFQEAQCTLLCRGRTLTACIHVLAEEQGIVVTFDNVTELIAAQKKAAWSDVARRIAHEVKNPLTPIVLSAERLKRKYAHHISPPDIFRDCIETIIRQVGYIGKLISEFSSFARMPLPVFQPISLDRLIQQEIALQEEAYPALSFTCKAPPTTIACDAQQISQVLTNILKNAIDSVQERCLQAASDFKGIISTELSTDKTSCFIEICDNGMGLPKEMLETLCDPYVTTKSEGMGLGLAIVKKIIEDHAGDLSLCTLVAGGTRVYIRLLIQQTEGFSKKDPLFS